MRGAAERVWRQARALLSAVYATLGPRRGARRLAFRRAEKMRVCEGRRPAADRGNFTLSLFLSLFLSLSLSLSLSPLSVCLSVSLPPSFSLSYTHTLLLSSLLAEGPAAAAAAGGPGALSRPTAAHPSVAFGLPRPGWRHEMAGRGGAGRGGGRRRISGGAGLPSLRSGPSRRPARSGPGPGRRGAPAALAGRAFLGRAPTARPTGRPPRQAP